MGWTILLIFGFGIGLERKWDLGYSWMDWIEWNWSFCECDWGGITFLKDGGPLHWDFHPCPCTWGDH